MIRCLLFLLSLLLFTTCKTKVKEADGASGFFPVLSYLQSQVRQVDTSVYSITKITKTAGRQDTVYLRREEFRAAAQDFLALPDLTAEENKYTETKLYDEDLKKVVISYAPKNKAAASGITRQEILIEPGDQTSDQVQTIYIETALHNSDSTVQKRLTWNVAKNFQVITIINKEGRPETVQTTDVFWGAPF